MRLDTRELHDLLLLYPSLDQCSLGKPGEHHRGCWGRCRAFVPRHLLVMPVEREATLPLDDAVDQQAQHRQHRSRRHPCGLRQPHGSDGSRMLDPAKARFHGGVWVLIGLENLHIRTALSAYRRGPSRPPLVLFRIGPGLNLHRQAIARLWRRWAVFAGRPRRARRVRQVSSTRRSRTA
jgi:hypothetical protein